MSDTTPEYSGANPKNEVLCADNIVSYAIRTPVDHDEAWRLTTIGKGFIDAGKAQYVLTNLRKSIEFSSSARKIWVEFLKNDKIKKTAIFGGNVLIKTLATFMIVATGKKDIKFFNTEEEARAWFRE